MGFTQPEARAILNLNGSGLDCCGEVQEIAVHHLDRVQTKMRDLAQLEALLAATIARCAAAAPTCAVIDMLEDTTPMKSR